MTPDLTIVESFEWDKGNSWKNDKPRVRREEAEQVFFHEPLLLAEDGRHGGAEDRFHAMGVTTEGRRLHVTFALRGGGSRIRVISARPMSRKERKVYDEASQSNS
jgi:hypothetical protein